MLIMKYSGGLGNQMFQYAAVASLADKLGVSFAFDASFFDTQIKRAYELNIFGIAKNDASDIRTKLAWKLRKFSKKCSFFGLNVYAEKAFNYEERFLKIIDNTFIWGYFQSYKYVNEDLIKKTFVFKAPLSEKNASLISKMKLEDSISLHIRRGDYTQKRYVNVYNQLDIDYYKKALEILAEKSDNPVIYVFSDDIAWARENLNFTGCPICIKKGAKFEFISHNCADTAFEDMRLMSNCKHNIIANSSFSWWGAYLNNNPDKIVIAPKNWFTDTDRADTKSLFPPSWYILEC